MGYFQIYSLRCVSMLVMASLLTACGTKQEEVQSWMDAQLNQQRPMEVEILAPQVFLPEDYVGGQLVDPFDETKLTEVLKESRLQTNALLAFEMNRRKDPLEAFPLDSIKMVGNMQRKGVQYALLKVDTLVYTVKAGDYLGQNYGKIMKISEADMSIREIVQDAAGEWIDRLATLQIQEETK